MSLTSEGRILKTLRREAVDRIPTFEWFVDKKVIEAIYPGLSYQEFVYQADQDAISMVPARQNLILLPKNHPQFFSLLR